MIQIYCDFSGYSDIATGCAKMMGVELMVNFNRPFISETLSEFWARWHISLSSWFKDYIYTPMNYRAMGKKHLEARMHFNLLVLFFVSGLWHGANWTFVVWGLFNGVCQILGSLMKKAKRVIYQKVGLQEKGDKYRVLRIIRTTAVLALGLVLFRSNTLANAGVFFVKIFSDWSFSIDYLTKTFAGLNIDLLGAFTAILLFVLMIFVDRLIMEPRGKDVLPGDKSVSVHFNYVYIVWLIAAAWLLLIANGQSSGFIYFQF
jgi:D-alanyl-lipoteichoic acid acyltransferase DltB (MBOAT superfamily)